MSPIDVIRQGMLEKIESLEFAANVSLTIAIAVAVIAAAMGISQLKQHRLIRGFVVLGSILIPGLQVIQFQVFPHSYQSYRLMKNICTSVLIDMDLDHKRRLLANISDQTKRNEIIGALNSQQWRCLGQGLEHSDSKGEGSSASSGAMSLVSPAYAESEPRPPAWVTTPQAMGGNQCFLGKAMDRSLDAAETTSLENARAAAEKFYASAIGKLATDFSQSVSLRTITSLLCESSSVERSYYTFDPGARQFEVYKLLCVSRNRVRSAVELFSADTKIEMSQRLIRRIQEKRVEAQWYSLPEEDAAIGPEVSQNR